jgi:hypothetical protein
MDKDELNPSTRTESKPEPRPFTLMSEGMPLEGS